MWIVTTTGFFSVVRAKRKGLVQVRARQHLDLVGLRRRFGLKQRLISTPQADYPFRMVVPLPVWQAVAAALAGDVAGYANFKTAVAETSASRADIYHEVWDVLRDIEAEYDA